MMVYTVFFMTSCSCENAEVTIDELVENAKTQIALISSEEVKELLKYDEDTAGGIMSSDYVSVTDDDTIRAAVRGVRDNAENFEQIYHIYVVQDSGELVGIVPFVESHVLTILLALLGKMLAKAIAIHITGCN